LIIISQFVVKGHLAIYKILLLLSSLQVTIGLDIKELSKMKRITIMAVIFIYSHSLQSIEITEGTCRAVTVGTNGINGKDSSCAWGDEFCGINARAGRHGGSGRHGDSAEINIIGAKKSDVITITSTCHGSVGGNGGNGGKGNICGQIACSSGAAGGHGGNGGDGGVIHIQSDESINPKNIKFANCPVLAGKPGRKGKAGIGAKKGKLKTNSGSKGYNGRRGHKGRVLITVEGKTKDITKYACP
jgi:hypothetical protein